MSSEERYQHIVEPEDTPGYMRTREHILDTYSEVEICNMDDAADHLNAQAKRITELEAENERLRRIITKARAWPAEGGHDGDERVERARAEMDRSDYNEGTLLESLNGAITAYDDLRTSRDREIQEAVEVFSANIQAELEDSRQRHIQVDRLEGAEALQDFQDAMSKRYKALNSATIRREAKEEAYREIASTFPSTDPKQEERKS